ncbi:MAG: helix-turn-helix domain-containing protein [Candidatus Berkelbacteria bacterium]|nr:helix-turn-helix domain-containing protein [Candidatus Berkelbacteria bacterium]
MEEYFTTKEVAALFKIKPTTVRKWIRQGALPAIGFGNQNKEYRITKSELEAFIETRKTR